MVKLLGIMIWWNQKLNKKDSLNELLSLYVQNCVVIRCPTLQITIITGFDFDSKISF